MPLKVKKSGAYADPVAVKIKLSGAYQAVQGIFCKVTGAYQSVLGAAAENWGTIVTTSAELVSAASAATVGSIITIGADITAASLGTILTFPAGVKIKENAAWTVSGFRWKFHSAGNYTTTTIGLVKNRLIIDGTGTAADNATVGTVECRAGDFDVYCKITGASGASPGNRAGNIISFTGTSAIKCNGRLYGDYGNATRDVVSAFSYDASTPAHANSSVTLMAGATVHHPGAGGTDNWFTGHEYFKMYAFNATFTNCSASGPGINSAPVTSTMELYGCNLDFTGASATANNVTAMVGCVVTGPATASINIRADDNYPTQAAKFIKSSSAISVYAAGAHTVTPIIDSLTTTTTGIFVGSAFGAGNTGSTVVISRSTLGVSAANSEAIRVLNSADIYNCTVTATGVAANTYPIRAYTPSDASTATVNIFSCSINPGLNALNYACRNDAIRTVMAIQDSQTKCTTAINFTGSGGTFSGATNCTTDGSVPSGASVGASNACSQLQALPWYSGLVSYLATQPATPGAGTWTSGIHAAMGI